MEKILATTASFLWDTPLIFAILLTGFYFTLGSDFFQCKYFSHIMTKTFKKILTKSKNDVSKGILSPLEAVSTAIGGSVVAF